jgi:hypothetical protein
LSLPADFEISPAATVYPNTAAVTSPGTALDTGRTTALANQPNLAIEAFVTPMTLSIAGFAIEGLNVTATISTVIIPIPISITIPATTGVTVA